MLGEEPYIWPRARVQESYFGKYTEIADNTSIIQSSIDDFSYVMEHCSVIYASIGKFSNIASMVRINPGFHPIERPTLHHFTYRAKMYGFGDQDDDQFFHWRELRRVTIGHDTWIGHGSVIMPDVTIGNGAIVGSLSVVTKDVAPYEIVAGVPSKTLRYRFPTKIVETLQQIAWWDWPYEVIRERFDDFKDLRSFLWKYGSVSFPDFHSKDKGFIPEKSSRILTKL
ncbi:MAG: acetyltransferase [Deltaproteobacteria bacterium]|nr:acetyltransferase [Deltaproteobacteria bacterium]